jgi:hypothetical protein
MKTSSFLFALLLCLLLMFGSTGCEDPAEISVAPEEKSQPLAEEHSPLEPESEPVTPDPEMDAPKPGPLLPENSSPEKE